MSELQHILDRPRSSVHVAGDWHADGSWALAAIRDVAADGGDLILQVGDFGFFPNITAYHSYIRAVSEECETLGVTVLITPGNHENWTVLDHMFETSGGPARLAAHVWALPRGYRFELGEVSFMSFGGASSIDRIMRTRDITWFPTELSTPEQVQDAVRGGSVDVLITHEIGFDCHPDIAVMRTSNPHGMPEVDQKIASGQAALIQELAEGVQPKLHAHGHWHTPRAPLTVQNPNSSERSVQPLGMNRQPGNVSVIDLASLRWLPMVDHVHRAELIKHTERRPGT